MGQHQSEQVLGSKAGARPRAIRGVGRTGLDRRPAADRVSSKIENFIRTKYDSKRWAMDGGIPDPATMDDEGDEDIPLSVVQEKQKLDRSSSARLAATASANQAVRARAPDVDLFGDDVAAPAPRPSTTEPAMTGRPPPPRATASKAAKPGDSLLGLDFFSPSGTSTSATPSNATGHVQGSTAPSRPDLKQSILSLYATAPRPAESRPQPAHPGSFSALNSNASAAFQQGSQSSFGGLQDAFSGLNFDSAPPSVAPPKPSGAPTFPNLASFSQKSSPTVASSGGAFFDPPSSTGARTVATAPPPKANAGIGLMDDFGAFDSAPGMPSTVSTSAAAPVKPSAGLDDLFDFGTSGPPTAAASEAPKPAMPNSSVFNLSAPTSVPAGKAASASDTTSGWANNDAWGGNDVWSAPEPAATKPAAAASTMTSSMSDSTPADDSGWGNSESNVGKNGLVASSSTAAAPEISADEDFGGWSSSAPAAAPATAPMAASKNPSGGGAGGGGFTASEDLFSNVWE